MPQIRVDDGRGKRGNKKAASPNWEVYYELGSDQVIRENPASRGTEASAEVRVGPPMTDGVERRSTAVVIAEGWVFGCVWGCVSGSDARGQGLRSKGAVRTDRDLIGLLLTLI